MASEAPNNTDGPPCPMEIPVSEVYFAGISTVELALVAVGGVVALANVIMFLETSWFIFQHSRSQKTMTLSIWMTGVHPVFSLAAVAAVCVPRCTILVDLMAATYLAFCVWNFIPMLMHYRGGEHALISHMSGETINLRSPPVACCCFCCPKIEVNKKNLLRIKMTVLQFAVFRPILVLLTAALWTDKKYIRGVMMPNQPFMYTNIMNGASTLIAVYGSILLFEATRKQLKAFNIIPKFISLQVVLAISDLQTLVFDLLASNQLPPCTDTLPSNARGDVWNHLILIVEMFLLALLSRHAYRRAEGSQVITDIYLEDKNNPKKNGNSSLNTDSNTVKDTSGGRSGD
ncbi:organic solute transporter subunit alpha-like [Haliotis rubra]|uniref:organic solute transporter subunit alpha-like n=1 Tax=Haliotis rubra TaxID=36100 RepID=UPI001EE5234B|nr:organic solute transporter subunit alpha-like [Haliotis rubra]XP_046550403.1 organic solute transporter subunit alpha-like [Haliotis rubra]